MTGSGLAARGTLRGTSDCQHHVHSVHLLIRGFGVQVPGDRDVGHGHITEPGPGDTAGRLDDHVGGGLRGVVSGLGQNAGLCVGSGDDAGVAEHLLDHLQVGV